MTVGGCRLGVGVGDAAGLLSVGAKRRGGRRGTGSDRLLSGRLTALAISALWVGEYSAGDAIVSPEFAVADAVIELATKHTGERSIRYLTLLKLRGSDFASGEHAYRLSSNGLTVFPRLADSRDGSSYETDSGRLSTGIPAVDDALGDGYWPGSATLVVGPSGAGKTLMGVHFLYAGAACDEPGVLLTLEASRVQLSRIVNRFGWSISDPAITILDRSPVDVYIDELVYDLLGCGQDAGARRVVIDSLNDLMTAAPDGLRFREVVYSLIQRLARSGISIIFTFESPELFRITRLSELGVSHIADNVVLLQHLHDGAEMKRALTV